MAAALVELERHPGHVDARRGHVHRRHRGSGGRPRARRWPGCGRTSRPTAACSTTPAPGPPSGHRCLRGASRRSVARVETLTLDALATRMDTALREVTAVVTACDATHRAGLHRVGAARRPGRARAGGGPRSRPGRRRHRAAGGRAGRRRAGARPRPARARRPSVEDVLAPLADALGPVVARCAELAAVRDGWTAGLAELETALAAAAAPARRGRPGRTAGAGADRGRRPAGPPTR